MDTSYPHRIIDETELRKLPLRDQARFVPIPQAKVAHLEAMTPEQRGEWLTQNPIDAERIARAEAKRARKAAKSCPPSPATRGPRSAE